MILTNGFYQWKNLPFLWNNQITIKKNSKPEVTFLKSFIFFMLYFDTVVLRSKTTKITHFYGIIQYLYILQ